MNKIIMNKTFINKMMLLVLFAIFFLFSFPVDAQEKYTLKNRYPQGTYEMRLETDMDMTIKIGEQIIPNRSNQTQYQEIVAEPIEPDGSQQTIMEIKRIVLKQTINGQEIAFDSADEKVKNSPLRLMGVMVGLKVTTTFDPNGKITKVEGIEEFLEKHAQTLPKPALDMLKKQFSGKALTKTLDVMHEAMPKQPVAVGEQWKSENFSEIPMLGKVKTEQTNTLKEIQLVDETELAVIVSQSRMKSDSPQEMNMAAAKMMLNSTEIDSESAIQMEVKTGLVISNVTQIKMNLELETTAPNNQVVKQNVSGEGKTTMTITRAKK
ncbi:MAG: DUF6263 family protein [Planctomycetaceae bacterium]|nr:DUF6263 family protein [Planctomycetaceae bacterium]